MKSKLNLLLNWIWQPPYSFLLLTTVPPFLPQNSFPYFSLSPLVSFSAYLFIGLFCYLIFFFLLSLTPAWFWDQYKPKTWPIRSINYWGINKPLSQCLIGCQCNQYCVCINEYRLCNDDSWIPLRAISLQTYCQHSNSANAIHLLKSTGNGRDFFFFF